MKKIRPTIVVFGCTGTVGREVMHQLTEYDCIVRGVLRHPDRMYPVRTDSRTSNITYVSADLNSIEQLQKACVGADALFLLTATSPQQVQYEINIIDAAKQSGIKRIVKLSAPVVQPAAHVEVSQWHNIIDDYLVQNMDEFCCLRPHSFMQNWERNTFTIQYFGKIYGTLGDAKRNYIDCRDVATVAIHYLLTPEQVKEGSVILAGPQAISNIEMADKLSHVTGRKIEYVNITADEFFSLLTRKAKLPEWLASHIVELDNLALHIPEPECDTITNLILRKPRIMDEYLQEYRYLFKRKPFWKLLI
ncbi:NmrA family NAD(P)-binding protein [Sphingobacterium spiritivorum]|uniref:NmrA family protein n=1 Tax=Sphingobacterium spiritivorum ATCC 33861 TaxID=525373 RepID=D7VK67_SPHSI|nr:NmrA family NAD(P)-binding protein [Sphingobacterium spiritivorum]EFK58669.1 NmrA family protein [Sphingobacterium spiritivorum ATCC 33861]QQT34432.1 NmrA family NAD(P)-binding protein [Sphingobacterium spiritivorum]WQD35284.1 NmrA family NAD(P)-binding protein [Sphingobacterium spiritivorum]SUI99884.1 NAD(P)H azoreductase [Sphingobacterium spiritivorum]